MPWISDIEDDRLQRGHWPPRRRLDNVGLPSVHLGDALVDSGEIITQASNPLCGNNRKLLVRMMSIGQLGTSHRDLLIERHHVLLLLECGLLAPLQLDGWQRPALGQRGAR